MEDDKYYIQYCNFLDEITKEYADYKLYDVSLSYFDETLTKMTDDEARKDTIINLFMDLIFDKVPSRYFDMDDGNEEKTKTRFYDQYQMKINCDVNEYKTKEWYDKYVYAWCIQCEYSNK